MKSRLETTIDRVTLYCTSALITRRGRFAFLQKPQTLEVDGLPLWLEDESVRVSIVGDTPKAFVQEVQIGWSLEEDSDDEPHELTRAIEELALQREHIEQEQALLQEERSQLTDLHPVVPHPALDSEQANTPQALPLQGSLALLSFAQERLAAIDEALLSLVQKLEKLQEQHTALNLQKQLSAEQTRESALAPQKKLTLQLHPLPATTEVDTDTSETTEVSDTAEASEGSETSEELELELTYFVPGASWFPVYELRFHDGGAQAELVVQAQLAQVTEESWEDVALTLSTAQLHRSCELPRLKALRLGRQQDPPEPTGWRAAPEGTAQLFEAYDRAFAVQEEGSRETGSDRRKNLLIRKDGSPVFADRTTAARGRGDLDGMVPISGRAAPTTTVSKTQAGMRQTIDTLDESEYLGSTAGFGSVTRAGSYEESTIERIGYGGAGEMFKVNAQDAQDAINMLQDKVSKERAPKKKVGSLSMEAGFLEEAPEAALTKSLFGAIFEGGGGRGGRGQSMVSEALPTSEVQPVDSIEVIEVQSWMQYAHLRMVAADKPGRGSLQHLTQDERLLELGDKRFKAVKHAMRRFRRQRNTLREASLPRFAQKVEQGHAHFDHAYNTKGRFSIPSDGQYHKVTLQRLHLPASLVYRSVPIVEEKVYREARLQNDSKAPLLQGPVQVFWQGDYLLTSPLETVPIGGNIHLGLGEEEQLRIARNTTHQEETRGLLGNQQVLQQSISIELQSHLTTPATVEVLERIPISTDQKTIRVLEEHSSPKAEEYDQTERHSPLEGGRIWHLTVAPKGKQRCSLRYQVQLPTKQQLQQGNRRP